MTTAYCLYCDAELGYPEECLLPVPAIDDELAWHIATLEHAEWCEWIATRAHMRGENKC
jgi:hypothetical protein